MYHVHGFLDGKILLRQSMDHLPRIGDTVRFSGERYGRVTEVVWCMDESQVAGQRVNLRIETEEQEE